MSDTLLNTSRAKTVTVDIYDYDNLPLALTYTSSAVPIDLTDYKFQFILKNGSDELETYTLDAGDLSSAHLAKTGADLNVLTMEPMWEDIRDNQVTQGGRYTLIQIVTDPDDNPYAHIIWTINAKQY